MKNFRHLLFWVAISLFAACAENPPEVIRPEPEPETDPFRIEVYDITAITATVEVEPLDQAARYYTDVLNEADYQTTLQYGFDDYLNYLLSTLTEQYGVSRTAAVEMISSFGNDGFILTSLKPESNYYAVAVGIDAEGKSTTQVVAKAFSTTPHEVSENRFEVEFGEVTFDRAAIRIATTNNDPYLLTVEPRFTTRDLSDDELADYIIQSNLAWGGLAEITFEGDTEIDHLGKSGWEYEVIAFGYNNGLPTTAITRVPFTMAEGGDPAACTFTSTQSFDNFKLRARVSPSDRSVVYVCNLIQQSDLEALVAATGSEEAALEENLEMLYEELILDLGSRARAVEIVTTMGETSYDLNFRPSTVYYQWAVAVDQEGNPTAPFYLSEPFTTPEEVASTASLTLKEYAWYDGTELAKLYPEQFKGAKGYAVVDLTVEPSADAEKWWSYVAIEDLSDRSRQVVINNLLYAPTQPNLTRQFVVAYWGVNTIMGVAQDAEGNYGPLMLQVVDLQKETARPASELKL